MRPAPRDVVVHRALGLVMVACAGCAESASSLLVHVRTDLVAGQEFVAIRTELLPDGGAGHGSKLAHPRHLYVSPRADFVGGQRVAEYPPPMAEGTHLLSVSLLGRSGAFVAGGATIVQVHGTTTSTLVIARDCTGVTCPLAPGDPRTTCFGGRCVEPRCTRSGAPGCESAECTDDADCGARSACAIPRCFEGVCLFEPIEGACPVESFCAGEAGCRRADAPEPDPVAPADGGATPPDVPDCDPERCNARDDDCDGRVDEDGACGPSCGDGACNGGESCTSCAGDCGACGPSCGDGTCNGGESCGSCAGDCGTCPCAMGHGGGGEHGDPCLDPPEAWRCVSSSRLGTTVSQVCRYGAWQSYATSPRDCGGCCGGFSPACCPWAGCP